MLLISRISSGRIHQGLILSIAFASFIFATIQSIEAGTQVRAVIEHDLSRPTFGLQGPIQSQVSYNDQDGLAMRGTINDLLGPPIKIANGISQMIAGGNMAGIGSSMRTDGAILGFDSKLLEAAGGAKLLKGGLLFGGSAAKVGAAKLLGGLPGKKIASVIELPVKVVALKDLAVGKGLVEAGRAKESKSEQYRQEGEELTNKGNTLKQQGFNQVQQGINEGMQNINNIMNTHSSNTNAAIKLLPIILDLPMPGQQQVQQQVTGQEEVKGAAGPTTTNTKNLQQQQQHHSGSFGGGFFGGLSSLLPGFSSSPQNSVSSGSNPLNPFSSPFHWLGGGQNGQQHGYAAVINSTNPLTSMLMNPSANPFLMPMTGGSFAQALNGGPFGQSVGTKSTGDANSGLGGLFGLGAGGLGAGLGQQQAQQQLVGQEAQIGYNLLPGVRVHETMSMQMPSFRLPQQQQHQQQQVKQQQVQHQEEQLVESTKSGQVAATGPSTKKL